MSTSYNPRTQRFTVWGAHADYANGSPIMMTSGTVPECRAESNFRRDAGGWTLLTVREGERPSESWLTFAREQAIGKPAEHRPVLFGDRDRRVCSCGDFDCASLDALVTS